MGLTSIPAAGPIPAGFFSKIKERTLPFSRKYTEPDANAKRVHNYYTVSFGVFQK
jgi:hypothetical protein